MSFHAQAGASLLHPRDGLFGIASNQNNAVREDGAVMDDRSSRARLAQDWCAELCPLFPGCAAFCRFLAPHAQTFDALMGVVPNCASLGGVGKKSINGACWQ
jgi:hypothetical protein